MENILLLELPKDALGKQKIGEYIWVMETTEAGDAAAVATTAHAKCTMQSVQTVVKPARFRSSLQKADRFTAEIASRSTANFSCEFYSPL